MVSPAEPVTTTFFDNDTTENQIAAAEIDASLAGEPGDEGETNRAPVTTPLLPPPALAPAPDAEALQELARLRQERAGWQQQRAELEQQRAAWEEQRAQQAAETAMRANVQQYRTSLEDQGFSPEQAEIAAQGYHRALQYGNQQIQQYNAQVKYQRDKEAVAQHFAAKYGVPARSLMAFSTPEEMEEAALERQRYMAQDKRIKELEKGRVTPQQFNSSGGGRGGTSDDQFLEAYSSGRSDAHASARKILNNL